MANLRVGIVGLGRLGMRHAESVGLSIRGADLVAACSINPDEIARARSILPDTEYFDDYGEMLDRARLDAVIIVSSSGLHSTHIALAMEHGIHVFSETPLGITIAECHDVERAVLSHPELVFMLGFMRRFDPTYADAKHKIDSGAIGTPFLVRAYGLDPDSLIEGALRFAPTSGGIFLDMMIHDIDLARWFLGREPVMVHALGGTFKYPSFRESGDVDNATALMQFEDDRMAIFYTGRTAPHGYHIETEIVGTEGHIRIDGVPRKNRAVIYSKAGATEECVTGFPERFDEAFKLELQEFIDCIRENRKPGITVHDGTRATVIGYAATESLRERRPVYIEP